MEKPDFICEGSICPAITIRSFLSLTVRLILHLSCLLFTIFLDKNLHLLIIDYKICWFFASPEACLVYFLEHGYWLKYPYLSCASTIPCKYKQKHFYVKNIFLQRYSEFTLLFYSFLGICCWPLPEVDLSGIWSVLICGPDSWSVSSREGYSIRAQERAPVPSLFHPPCYDQQ